MAEVPGAVTVVASGAIDDTNPDAVAAMREVAPPLAAPVREKLELRSTALLVLAVLASLFALRWASAVVVPVLVAVLFSYGLSPIVDWAQRHHVPRALSAAMLVLGLLGGIGATLFWLSDDANQLVERLPAAAQKLRDSIRPSAGGSGNPLDTVQKVATQLEQAAEESTRATPTSRGVQRVQVVQPKFNIKDHLWVGTLGLLSILAQIGIMALITFFLMQSGDQFRRKLVKLAGPTLSQRRITLQALNEIHDQIQRYMPVQLFTSFMVGVATWLSFMAIGMEHAAVWGIAAGVLDLVPYFGSVAMTSASSLVAFLQFGSLETAVLVGGISLLIHLVEAFVVTPWLTSRANKMNPVAVFVGVLGWGWMWGVWGLLLAVPMLVAIKAVCDRVEDLKPVGELLGD